MPTSSKYGTPDHENPEWEKGGIAKAMRLKDLPEAMQLLLTPKKGRGPQKAPRKEPVSIRLSPDVLAALRSRGRGWQTLADDALRKTFVTNSQ